MEAPVRYFKQGKADPIFLFHIISPHGTRTETPSFFSHIKLEVVSLVYNLPFYKIQQAICRLILIGISSRFPAPAF